jgi:hypothetical protein
MPGGLIQIASYGSQDLTLTGNPQITYFKIVFRRYTNFGIRTVEIPFDGVVDFSTNSTLTIPKSADLLTKATLKIKLPGFNLQELNNSILKDMEVSNTQTADLEKYYIYYDYFINFINKLQNIVITFFKLNNNNYKSITYIQDLKKYILKFIGQDEYLEFFNVVNFYLYNGTEAQKVNIQNKYTNTFTNASLFYLGLNNVLTYVYENYTESEYSYDIFQNLINANMEILQKLNTVIYSKMMDVFTKPNIVTLGWIEKIGIFIMENVELFIGSNKVSSMSSNYIDLYGQLNYKNVEIYNKMIGKDPELNVPVTKLDAKYLYVPLPFWFENNYGLAVPLVALQYNNILIKIKFRNFIDTIFFDIPNISSFTNSNIRDKIIDLITENTINIFTSQMEITMLLEYVYLDNVERKKFAQSSHEYLITQVQEVVFTNVSAFNADFELDFFHCCKTMFWNANQYKYINNVTGKNIYDKYTVTLYEPTYNLNSIYYENFLKMLYSPKYLFNLDVWLEGLNYINTSPINNNFFVQDMETALIETNNFKNYEVSPFEFSQLTLNGVTLIAQNTSYFNYLQPYNYYKNTPSLGINVYSFSINPTETQPSGACNLSRIPKTSIKFKLVNPDSNLINVNLNENYSIVDNLSLNNLSNYKIYVSVENYNILRFVGGVVGTAFTY